MIKKLTNKKIVLISATVMIVVLTLGFTLALWSRNFTQTGTNTITSDCFNIEYSENDATSLVNAYPQTDEDGLKNVSYDVTIENTCNTVTNYSVVLNELSSNTLSESHVKVAVNDSYKMLNTYEEATPSADVDNASSARLLTLGVLGPEQEKTISIKSWIDEATTEAEGENKTFGYRITIEANAGTNRLLAAEIFNTISNYSTTPTINAFRYGEPTGERGLNGLTYKEVQLNSNDTLTLTTSQYIGDGYSFNSATGRYTLTNYTLYTDEDDLTDKYTCGGTYYSNCDTIYKLKAYNGATAKILIKYTSVASVSGSGIFSAPDNDGTSYYLRGEIDNNYISFANKKWRVVRINGDGTIRLILNSSVGTSAFNPSGDRKYAGYTYDNNKLCTNASPCDGTEGISSTIKNYLDNWYTTNLVSYEEKLSTSLYCNDTTYTINESVYYYGAYSRRGNIAPSLECPDTSVNYGGIYKLKIGLITIDELIMSGINSNAWHRDNHLYYLYNSGRFWTGSPLSSYLGNYIYDGGRFNNWVLSSAVNVHPVINLVSDVKVASGNGTQSTPYVIDMN